MRAAQDNPLNPHYQSNKEVSFDKYDSESDIEDQLREEAEIKRIITEAKKKKPSKRSKIQGFEGESALTDFGLLMQNKSAFRDTAKGTSTAFNKLKSPKGFLPEEWNSKAQIDADDKLNNLNKMLNYRQKINSQVKGKAKTQGFYNIEIETGFEYNKEALDTLQRALTSPKTRFPKLIATSPVDQEFHKQSFQSLLSLYNRSTSNRPTKLFTEKLYFPHDRSPLRVEKANSSSKRENIIFSKRDSTHAAENTNDENVKTGIRELKKNIKEVIYDLISAVLVDAFEPFDKKNPEEIPRMKMMDWSSILKKTEAKRFELLIMNPITFTIEEYQEIVSENPQEIKDWIHGTIRELLPTTNEAKYILVFYYEKDTNKKHLLFHKFFYFLKNHKYYLDGFKNEKEIITYYLIILSILQLRITYENNPFKDDKIEQAQKKAKSIIKNTEELNSLAIDWFINKVQHFIAIEKAYINLNVGGKADSNFSFSLHEHFTYTFPKFSSALHGPKVKRVELPVDSRLMTTPFSPKAGKSSDREGCARFANMRLDTSKDMRGTNASSLSNRRAELSPSVVGYVGTSEEKKFNQTLSRFNTHKDTLAKVTQVNSPLMTALTQPNESLVGKRLLTGGFIPSKFGYKGDENHKEMFAGKNDFPFAIQPPQDNKKRLDHDRMNTSYTDLLKKRNPGMKIAW